MIIKTITQSVLLLTIALFTSMFAFSQSPQEPDNSPEDAITKKRSNSWMSVGTEDGGFTIDVPVKHTFIKNDQGFYVSNHGRSYKINSISFLSSWINGSLVSFESYETQNAGSISSQLREPEEGKKSKLKIGNRKAYKYVRSTPGGYSVRLHIKTRKRIFIITAASRKDETPEIKRFLDSIEISSSDAKATNASSIRSAPKIFLADLKESPVFLNLKYQPKKKTNAATTIISNTDKDLEPLWILTKPRPYFTAQARQKGEQGKILLRINFDASGLITKIDVINSLENGLLRQAVFAALRMRYMPAEKDGVPYALTKRIQYSYAIY